MPGIWPHQLTNSVRLPLCAYSIDKLQLWLKTHQVADCFPAKCTLRKLRFPKAHSEERCSSFLAVRDFGVLHQDRSKRFLFRSFYGEFLPSVNGRNSLQILALVKITIRRLQNIRHALVNHLLQYAQPVEVFGAVIVLHVDHHDVLHAAIVL